MKKIKELYVSVNYEVSLRNIEVSDEVYEALKNNDFFNFQDWFASGTEKETAMDWLTKYVKEENSLDRDYFIEHLECDKE